MKLSCVDRERERERFEEGFGDGAYDLVAAFSDLMRRYRIFGLWAGNDRLAFLGRGLVMTGRVTCNSSSQRVALFPDNNV